MKLTAHFSTIKNEGSLNLRAYYLIIAILLFSYNSFAQVGISTTSPTTTLDVNGALSLRESPKPLELRDGVNQDIELVGEPPYSVYRIEGPTTAFSIDGIVPVKSADGQIVRLINTTSQIMTIVHNGTGNEFKIVCPSSANLVIGGRNSSVTLQYSMELEKWTVFGYGSTSSNKYSVFATAAITTSSATKTDMDGMEITFTPVNSVVYVTYSAYGDVNPNSGEARFHLMMNGNVVNNTEMRTGSLSNKAPYRAILPMFPLSVTPGTPVTLKVQWWTNGSGTLNNTPLSWPSHGRYITVID